MPNQTPSPGVTITMALVGPNLAALTPADRAAIQSAMAQAIPSISASPFLFRAVQSLTFSGFE